MEIISLFEKREELRRVLQSKHFANAPKKTRFLEFVAEQALLGNAEKLNEYLIGVEVYARGSDFKPQDDPIVRVQAHDIRRALRKYYEEEGKSSSLRIDLPPGHSSPIFGKAALGEETKPGVHPVRAPAMPRMRTRWHVVLVVGLATACVILSFLLLIQERSRNKPPVQPSLPTLPEGLEWFWKPFLPPADPPVIVIPNHPLLRAAHDGDRKSVV